MVVRFIFNSLVTVEIVANQNLNLGFYDSSEVDQPCVYNLVLKSDQPLEKGAGEAVIFYTTDGVFTVHSLLGRQCSDSDHLVLAIKSDARQNGAEVLNHPSDHIEEHQVIYRKGHLSYVWQMHLYFQIIHNQRLRSVGFGFLIQE